MQVLINSKFKALRQGQFVQADESVGEFILDTSNEKQFEYATLSEIAEANGLKLKKGNKKDVLTAMEEHFIKRQLPEMNKMSESQKVMELVKLGIEAGKSDDEILVEIVMSGIPFKKAGRMFKAAIEESGLRISTVDRVAAVNEILTEAEFTPENYGDVEKMIEQIVKNVKDTNTVQAMKLIKKFCKENEIEFPKRPAKPKGGLLSRFRLHLLRNPALTAAEMEDWLVENTKPEKVDSFVKKFTPWLEFCINVQKAIAGELTEADLAEQYEEEEEESAE